MLADKIRDAIGNARKDGRDVQPIIEELFLLLGEEIDGPAKQAEAAADAKAQAKVDAAAAKADAATAAADAKAADPPIAATATEVHSDNG
jgi:hypothetical protein